MLTERQIPLEISSLKGSHCRVMLGLFRYADKDGACWPSLRTLSAAVPMSIRALRRAIEEMGRLGYVAVTKIRGSVNRYRISARFLRAMGRGPRPQSVPETSPAEVPEPDDRQLAFEFGASPAGVSPLRTGVPPLRTEGIAKESQEEFIRKEGIPFGRDAPLEQPLNGAVCKITDSPGVKAIRKEARRQKVLRFILAKYSGEDLERRMNGMLGLDEVRDAQWWFDECDTERKVADWDDMRDRSHGYWQLAAC